MVLTKMEFVLMLVMTPDATAVCLSVLSNCTRINISSCQGLTTTCRFVVAEGINKDIEC
jgi:hypothetical protein